MTGPDASPPDDPNRANPEISRLEADLAALDIERARLRMRLEELRFVAAEADAAATVQPAPTPTTTAGKVALFMSLFRGRADVHALRWQNSRKGTQGFAPACGNEWIQGVCNKPRIKCGACPSQAFLPVTEEAVAGHLRGRHVMGLYPLLPDETCWFLAVDFDKAAWREDVDAFAQTCRRREIPFVVERSQSGNGAHVWFFFESPVSARAARRMGCLLLTETMDRRHELSMESYDRLFPSQDTLPKGGFGNLIALPFQGGAREQGNSVFVDRHWVPHQDQWEFLASVGRMSSATVTTLASEAATSGELGAFVGDIEVGDYAPWDRPPSGFKDAPIQGPLPEEVEVVFAQLVFVHTKGLPSTLINRIRRLAVFQNPEFYKKQALRLSTALTPRMISCAEDHPHHIALPRGAYDDLRELMSRLGIRLQIQEERTTGDRLDALFRGSLRNGQAAAVSALLSHDLGVFVAPPGAGKTVVGANLIAARGRNTLVIVHRTQLLEQWRAQLSVFLDMEVSEIGQIGGGRRKPNGQLDVAMLQSLFTKKAVADRVTSYGHVIVDECHHVPAVSFERVMREVKARYVLGLTATPTRRDGHQPIIQLQLGPTRHTIGAKKHAASRRFEHLLVPRQTEFRLSGDGTEATIHEVYRQLVQDAARNRLIIDDVASALKEGRSPIVLTERRAHLKSLAEQLRNTTPNLIVLHGGMRPKQRHEAIERIKATPAGRGRLVLATGRFIGEGFDDARLDTLFLAMPVSWKGTLVQYAGRLHRAHRAKTEVRMVDYVDKHVPMLARMFERRKRGYAAMGYAEERTEAQLFDGAAG